MVEVSWIAKPCESSSRCMRFRCPPYFGAWADDGVTDATTTPRHSETATAKVRERSIVLLSLRRPRSRTGAGGETLAKYTAWALVRQPFQLPSHAARYARPGRSRCRAGGGRAHADQPERSRGRAGIRGSVARLLQRSVAARAGGTRGRG